MKNLPLLIITMLGTLVLIVGIAVFFSQGGSTQTALKVDPAQLAGEARHSKGPAEAKVTVVEFSDFQCPACRAVYPLVEDVGNRYPNDVRIVYRHFPLNTIHPYAQMAGQAAAAAGEFNKFWEMHDLLFDRQSAWSTVASEQAARDVFVTYAEELTIDKEQFLAKIDSDSVKNIVNQDLSFSVQQGLNATPTLFVNGQQTAPDQLLTTVESLLNSN